MDKTFFDWYTLKDGLLEEIEQFAQNSNNNYHKRNQTDKHRILQQAVMGKVAEWATYYKLLPHFAEVTEPDMRIFEPDEKSWKSDIVINNSIEVACKSCDYATKQYFNLSWVFQWKDQDGYGKDKSIFIPGKKDKLCIMSEISKDYKSSRIRSLVPLSYLHQNDLFEQPKKIDLKKLKKVVYYTALQISGFGTGVVHNSVTELLEKEEEHVF